MKEIKSQLKYVKQIDGLVNPDPVWVSENKTRLMSQIANTAKPQKQIMDEHEQMQYAWYGVQRFIKLFLPKNMARSIRPIVTVVLALLITSSGWIASAYAQPGDRLWNAKSAVNTVIEKSQLAFADDTEDIKLNLKFASKRAQEIKIVVNRKDISSEEKVRIVQKTSDDLGKNLDDAREGIKYVDSENTSVKDVSLKTKEIAKSLKESTEKVSDELSDTELKKNLIEKTIDAQKISLEMVETVVQKKFDAQIDITEEEKIIITDHINEVVETISKDTQKVQEQTDDLVKNIEELPTETLVNGNEVLEEDSKKDEIKEVEDNNIDNENNKEVKNIDDEKNSENTTSSVMIDTTSTVAVIKEKTKQEQVHDVAERVDDTVKSVDSEKQKVQILIEEDNMLEAIKKTRELTDVLEKTVAEVTHVSDDVLPVIQNTGIREGEGNDSLDKEKVDNKEINKEEKVVEQEQVSDIQSESVTTTEVKNRVE